MLKLKSVFYLIVAVVALSNCSGGGGGGKGTPSSGSTSEPGVRIYLASGSTVTGEVYGGPVPSDAWSVAQSPTSYGYVHLGSLGPSSALSSVLTGTGQYQYVLIKVQYGAVSTSSTSYLRIDAVQRLSDNMYMTGMTNSGYTFSSTNSYNENRPFLPPDPTEPDYSIGAPDGRCIRLYGWELIPLIDWAQ